MPKTFITFCTVFVLGQISLATSVHGHRGSRWTHPENTIPALAEALQAGADVLEFDLGLTKDGVLILSHDTALNNKICRYTDGRPIKAPFVIHQKTLSETLKIDCGSMINPRFPQQQTLFNTKMPTLSEVFQWLKNSKNPHAQKVEFNIETKLAYEGSSPTASPKEFALALAKELKKHSLVKRTIVQSFDFRSLQEIRKILPSVRISLLVWKQSWDEIKTQAKTLSPNMISPSYKWINKDIVNEAQSLGYQVIPWTANQEGDWKKMVQLGVDGIITDRPRDLIDFLKSQR